MLMPQYASEENTDATMQGLFLLVEEAAPQRTDKLLALFLVVWDCWGCTFDQ